MTKPAITPVEVNREAQSEFLKYITEKEVEEIEPDFLDYAQDIKQADIGSLVTQTKH